MIGPVTGGIGTGIGVPVMTGGCLPPPGKLLVMIGGIGVEVPVMTGGCLPPVGVNGMDDDPTGVKLPPPDCVVLLELVAFMPPPELAAFMPPDGVNGMDDPTGIKPPPPDCVVLLELVAFMPPPELVAFLSPVGVNGMDDPTGIKPPLGCLVPLEGCLPLGLRALSALWPPVLTARDWASAGVLCSAVVTSRAAPSANAADGVRSLKFVIDMLLSVPVAAPFAATQQSDAANRGSVCERRPRQARGAGFGREI